jgi:hypothetical protein
MDASQVDLATTIVRELALNARKLLAVVDDEVVRGRFRQWNRDIEAQRRKRGNRARRGDVPLALVVRTAAMVAVWATTARWPETSVPALRSQQPVENGAPVNRSCHPRQSHCETSRSDGIKPSRSRLTQIPVELRLAPRDGGPSCRECVPHGGGLP